MVLKFSSLVLAVSQLHPTGLGLTSWRAKGGKVLLSELWKEHGQKSTLLIYLLSPTERGKDVFLKIRTNFMQNG